MNVSIWGQASDLISSGERILWTVFHPVLSGHLAIPRRWPLNTGSTVYKSPDPNPSANAIKNPNINLQPSVDKCLYNVANITRAVIGRCSWPIRVQTSGWRHGKLVSF